jgi:hypothetical protein
LVFVAGDGLARQTFWFVGGNVGWMLGTGVGLPLDGASSSP